MNGGSHTNAHGPTHNPAPCGVVVRRFVERERWLLRVGLSQSTLLHLALRADRRIVGAPAVVAVHAAGPERRVRGPDAGSGPGP